MGTANAEMVYEVKLSDDKGEQITVSLPASEVPEIRKPYRYQGKLWLVTGYAFLLKSA